MKIRPPMNFKLIELQECLAKIAGSAQPGGYALPDNMEKIINSLKDGKSSQEAEVPEKLLSNLNHIYNSGVKIIYNLTTIPNPLTKYLWEKHFEGIYITELEGVAIAIDNFSVPTLETMNLIVGHIKFSLENGVNVLVHCEGGLGRTGAVLAATHMAINNIQDADISMSYIKEHYSKYAIDDNSQIEFLRYFGQYYSSILTSLLEYNNDSSHKDEEDLEQCLKGRKIKKCSKISNRIVPASSYVEEEGSLYGPLSDSQPDYGCSCIVMCLTEVIPDNQRLVQEVIVPYIEKYNHDNKSSLKSEIDMVYVEKLDFSDVLINEVHMNWYDLGLSIRDLYIDYSIVV